LFLFVTWSHTERFEFSLQLVHSSSPNSSSPQQPTTGDHSTSSYPSLPHPPNRSSPSCHSLSRPRLLLSTCYPQFSSQMQIHIIKSLIQSTLALDKDGADRGRVCLLGKMVGKMDKGDVHAAVVLGALVRRLEEVNGSWGSKCVVRNVFQVSRSCYCVYDTSSMFTFYQLSFKLAPSILSHTHCYSELLPTNITTTSTTTSITTSTSQCDICPH
jgi:hypothetical protein